MKSIHYIYILSVIAALTACKDDIAPTYTVGEADNAIVLGAGISEGAGSAVTRAGGAEDHHTTPGHVAFTENTVIKLRVDGEWWKTSAATSGEKISKETVAKAGDIVASTDDKHRELKEYTPTLYWDDYGTADPNNIGTSESPKGRNKGLTIYGVAVDGVTTAVDIDGTTDGKKWTDLSWNVGTPSGTPSTLDQSGTDYWKNQDLLISNNVKDGGLDGTYKFDQRTQGKLLEFTHAMSKITVRLIASDGFPTTGVGATTAKFAAAPEVTLTSNETGQTNTEWANTACSVNVETGAVTGTSIPAVIKMHEADRTSTSYTVTFDALVAPGSEFKDKGSGTNDPYPVIARINADGNIYYVTAEKIRAAITTKYGSGNEMDFKTQPGFNYVITVNVKKTKIEVTATIKNWEDVTAAEVSPVINVSATYGDGSGTALSKDGFSFYRSTSFNNGYSEGYSSNANGYFAAESQVNKPNSGTTWTFTNSLYWSDHNTHYQMRGVWPLTTTDAAANDGKPRVETSTNNSDYQVIKVNNVAYSANTFPSDLAIGRPNVATDAKCSNTETGHTQTNLYSGGICATEGTINLEFEYMMSQVEVNLSTTDGSDKVELTNAKIEVTNLFTTGEVKLGDRDVFLTGSTDVYELHASSTANQFKDAIVPQALAYSTAGASDNVRFKITITNNDAVLYVAEDAEVIAGTKNVGDVKTPATQDIYYADVEPILKSGSTTEKVAPNSKWERGVHYVYNLKLSKTKIDITAIFKDWITVETSQPVWF